MMVLMRRALSSVLFPLGLAALLVHCHGDDVGHGGHLVGAACHDHHDCVHRCVRGDNFPGGTCTVDCHDDFDCPDHTRCVDEAGGVCLLDCHDHHDCRGGYECRNIDRHGHGGRIHVCIDD
jgi:hypothetical protein